MTTNNRSFAASVWDIFCSLKLTMFLLIALAAVSIIGTIIPQGVPPEEYLATISTTKLNLYKSLGFFDMYHCWWFILLLCLLTLNLICCSIKRLPYIWKTVTRPEILLSCALETSLDSIARFTSNGSNSDLTKSVGDFLHAKFAKPAITQTDDGAVHLFAQKTPWCRLSVYIVHLSIIVIFIGAIIGSLFGYKGFVNIIEGQSVDTIMSRSEKEIPLGFSVRCEQFSVAHYASGAPKEFKSILTVLENGKPVPGYTNVRVIVNDPLTYKGITFYQSSYGNAGEYFFEMSDLNGKNGISLTVNGNSSVKLPDGSSMHILETTEDVSLFEAGRSGPAAHIEIHSPNGSSEKVVVYANHPELNIQHAQGHKNGLVLHYKGGQSRTYTGLQVARDPGVWIVWLGCILMVAGIYAAFFVSHRRIWVRIQGNNITVGGNSSKNQSAFSICFEQLTNKLKLRLSGGEHK